ncbi:MAG TPA: hypothetical protein VIX86_24740 [Streptosporangiaceae bacterium]
MTTSRGLIAAENQLTRHIEATATCQSSLVPDSVTAPLLYRQLGLVTADDEAFWAALAASSHGQTRPQAVASAAQKTLRDIRVIRALCSAGD